MKVKGPEWVVSAVEAAKEAHLYIIARPGPLIFVIKEQDQNDLVKTSLGTPHTCSCVQGARHNYCVHISFLLQRKYRLPLEHPWLTKISLTDADLESLLQMRHLVNKRPVQRAKQPQASDNQRQQVQTIPENSRSRNPVTEMDSCPICLEGFFVDDAQDIDYSRLPFCSSCGNSFHTRCIQMFLQHARQTKSKELCPYCRSTYEDGRSYEQPAKPQGEAQKETRLCTRCECPLQAKGIKRVVNNERYCSKCFVTLNSGMYVKGGRKVLKKSKQKNQLSERELALEFYRRFAQLQYRDITMNDHNLLLELENPYMLNISKKPLRFPSFLIWDCFEQKACNEEATRECLMCGGTHPKLVNLIVTRNDADSANNTTGMNFEQDDAKSDLELNTAAVATLLIEQGEERVSKDALQELITRNMFLELPCTHTVHKVCAVLGTLITDPSAIFIASAPDTSAILSSHKLKVFSDYCTGCKTPYLTEWLRGAKLASTRPRSDQSATKALPTSAAMTVKEIGNIEVDSASGLSRSVSLSVTGMSLPTLPSLQREAQSRPKPKLQSNPQHSLNRSQSLLLKSKQSVSSRAGNPNAHHPQSSFSSNNGFECIVQPTTLSIGDSLSADIIIRSVVPHTHSKT